MDAYYIADNYTFSEIRFELGKVIKDLMKVNDLRHKVFGGKNIRHRSGKHEKITDKLRATKNALLKALELKKCFIKLNDFYY